FDYGNGGAGFDLLVNRDEHFHNLAGHRRDDVRSLVGISAQGLCTAPSFRVRERNRKAGRPNDNINLFARFGSAFNSAIENSAVLNQQIAMFGFPCLEFVMTTIYLGEYTRVFPPYLDIGLITGNRGVQFHVFSFMQLYLLLRRSEMFMECDLRVHFS